MAASSSRTNIISGNVPTSATVIDFICLFTHDLKRKQKRWQDGVLKYHTFNKRIMVHDDRGHFIGDAHWQAETDLEEGDEFELDRGSAIVQVSDCTGRREQDLTELLDKRAQDVEKRRMNANAHAHKHAHAHAHANARVPMPSAGVTTPARPDQSAHFQLRHRPLSAMLGTPSRIGRAAIPLHSPFEARQMVQRAEETSPAENGRDSPPVKRRKVERSPLSKPSHARSLFGQTLTLSARPVSTPVARSQALRDTTNVEPSLQLLGSKDMPNNLAKTSNTVPEGPPDRSIEAVRPHQPPTVTKLKSTKLPKVPVVSQARNGRRENHSHRRRRDSLEEVGENELHLFEANAEAAALVQGRHEVTTLTPGRCGDAIPVLTGRHHGSTAKKANSPVSAPQNASIEPDARRDSALPVPKAPPVRKTDEPRTELRIRSRQKRGLLMLSERSKPIQPVVPRPPTLGLTEQATSEEAKQATPGPLQQGKHSNVGSPDICLPLELGQGHTRTAVLEPANSPSPNPRNDAGLVSVRVHEEPAKSVEVILESDDEPSQDSGFMLHESVPVVIEEPTKTSDATESTPDSDSLGHIVEEAEPAVSRKTSRDPPSDMDVVMESDEDSADGKGFADEPKVSNTRRLRSASARSTSRRQAQRILSDDESDTSSVDTLGPPKESGKKSSAPRITRMARKSVRSREIIGFVIPSEQQVFAPPRATATTQAGEARNEKAGETITKPKLHQEERQAAASRPTNASMGEVAKANTEPTDKPETRPRRLISNPATRGKKAAKREDAAGQPPQQILQLDPVAPLRSAAPKVHIPSKETTLPLPGFARANGGAWSRHAEDLLGMTRPAERPMRRR